MANLPVRVLLVVAAALPLVTAKQCQAEQRSSGSPNPSTTIATRSAPHVASAANGVAVPPPKRRRLSFPNGIEVEPLNGVEQPAACVWGDRPWSPIVGCQQHDGIDWYAHADGSYTTTRLLWRSDLGREEPVTLCVHPRDAVPAPTGGASRIDPGPAAR